MRVAVIMAGGSGERFWPLSRRLRPKQLLNLTSPAQSVLAEAVERIAPLIPPENIFIATGEHLVEPVRAARVGVPDDNILAEPCKRNTAGCLAYATARILARHANPERGADCESLQRDIDMAVLTADHVIGDGEKFRGTVDAILRAARERQALGVIGVVPTRPETGYGYVEVRANEMLDKYSKDVRVYPVAAFHEKPDAARAEDFIRSGNYFWNAGMFFWNVADFIAELVRAKPAIAQATLEMAGACGRGDEQTVRRVFEALPDISIDYALMEHAKNVLAARAEFTWDDIGSWPALERTYPQNAEGNILAGDPIALDCRDCIVYRDETAAARDVAVAVVGAENLVVVVTDDAVLVVPKDRAQDIKKAVAELGRRGAKQT